ncbi:UNKNOWN [Stylonychia lemnae]|uniref:Lebercilin domain-containing protein n=1 Tax=Stylonychia lemnae TaxID=5949 RepID=A0A078B6C5_STYLE|nr:UNKNOWN [Stylonychia lemnae]|eukprot:CDW89909.1 UNKNOWN [Stylonychia lemnae]
MATTDWNQNNNSNHQILSHRSQVNNPIPQGTKTIMDILPDPSTYQKLNNSPSMKSNHLFMSFDSDVINKLQEANEKFFQRVAELESIVSQAVEKTQKELKEASIKNITTHREPQFGDVPDVQSRNSLLKQMQKQIKAQQREIISLKNKLEALTSTEKVTEMENMVLNLERQNKEAKKQVKVINSINQDQKKAMQMLSKDTEYEEQMFQLKKELVRWKEKHTMLFQYKKEEDQFFKQKFEQLVSVQENRHKIKESIIQVKYNPNLILDDTSRIQSKSLIQPTKRLQRAGSQAMIRQNKDKKYYLQKRDFETQEMELSHEVDSLMYQITTVDRQNQQMLEEIKECQNIQKQMNLQQQNQPQSDLHRRNVSSQLKQIQESNRDKQSRGIPNVKQNPKKYNQDITKMQQQSNYQLATQNDSAQEEYFETIDSMNDREMGHASQLQVNGRESPPKELDSQVTFRKPKKYEQVMMNDKATKTPLKSGLNKVQSHKRI